jgi:hypothetical protein
MGTSLSGNAANKDGEERYFAIRKQMPRKSAIFNTYSQTPLKRLASSTS